MEIRMVCYNPFWDAGWQSHRLLAPAVAWVPVEAEQREPGLGVSITVVPCAGLSTMDLAKRAPVLLP